MQAGHQVLRDRFVEAARRHDRGIGEQVVDDDGAVASHEHGLLGDRSRRGRVAEADRHLTRDARVAAGASFPAWDSPMHWRMDRSLSGNNIMSMGIWYECFMRWLGPARSLWRRTTLRC